MNRSKIEWCDHTWNPVTGCLHGCEYCYARRIAERFGLSFAPKLGDPGMEGASKYDGPEGMDTMLELEKPFNRGDRIQPYPMAFAPTFHRYRLDEPQKSREPSNIFVCSMADLFGDWVPDEWIQAVFNACEAAPWHRYLFLTKNPQRYNDLIGEGLFPKGDNFWFGGTRTGKDSDREQESSMSGKTFLSIEPIHARMDPATNALELWDWVIIGAENSNRKNKVVPRREWIEEIATYCRREGVPVFMKNSLKPIWSGPLIQEFPWED